MNNNREEKKAEEEREILEKLSPLYRQYAEEMKDFDPVGYRELMAELKFALKHGRPENN